MIFRNSIAIIFFLLISMSKSFATEIEKTDAKDSLPEKPFSICRDSVFSFRSQKGFVPSLIHNFGEQACAPFKMNSKQVWMVAGGIAIAGALYLSDENIDKFFKPLKEKNNWINKSSPKITELGGTYGIAFVGAFGGYSLICEDRKAFHTTLLAAQAAITSGVWVNVVKVLAGRERPYATYVDFHHNFWWGPFQQFNSSVSKNRNSSFFNSFPSGHSTTAFSIATVFAKQYSEKKLVPVIAYTMASLVGISRMTEHAHWASDVFAGACLGYLCGSQVVKHERELEPTSTHASTNKIKSDYFFSVSGNQLMLNYCMTF